MELTPRIAGRLDRDFAGSNRDLARNVIEPVDIGDDKTEGSERIQAAMLMLADGDLNELLEAAALAETDWRDVLVNADLADEDWRQRVDAYLDGAAITRAAVRSRREGSRTCRLASSGARRGR